MAKKKSKGGWSFFGRGKKKAEDDDAALGLTSDDNDSGDDEDIYDKPKPTAPPPELKDPIPPAEPKTPISDNLLIETNKATTDSDADVEASSPTDKNDLDFPNGTKAKPMKKKKSRFGSFFGLGKKKKKKADSWEFDSDDQSSDSDDENDEHIKKRLEHMNNGNKTPDPNVKTDLFGHPIIEDDSAGIKENASTASSTRSKNRSTVERNQRKKKGVSFRKSVKNLLGNSSKARGRSTAFNDLMNEDAAPLDGDEELKAQQDDSWMVDVGGDRGKINTYFVEDDGDEDSDDEKEKQNEVEAKEKEKEEREKEKEIQMQKDKENEKKKEQEQTRKAEQINDVNDSEDDKPTGLLSDSEISLDAAETTENETEPEETDYSDAEHLGTGYDSDVLQIGKKPAKNNKLRSFLAGLEDVKEKHMEVAVPEKRKTGVADFLNQSKNSSEPEMEPGEPIVARILPENGIPSPIVKKEKPDFAPKKGIDHIKTKGAYEDFEESSLPASDDEIGENANFEYSTFETYKKSSDGESSSKKKKKKRRRKIKRKKKRATSSERGGKEAGATHSEIPRVNAPVWDADDDFDDSDDDDLNDDYRLAEKALNKSVDTNKNIGEIKIMKVGDVAQRNKKHEEKLRRDAEKGKMEELKAEKKALEEENAIIEQLKNERDELLQLKTELEMEHEKEDSMGKKKELERKIRLELKKEKEEMSKLKRELKRKRQEEKRRHEEELERLEEERIEEEKRQLEETRQMIADLEEEKRLFEEEEELKLAFELKERKRVEGLMKKERKRSKSKRRKTEYSLLNIQDVIFDLEDKYITPQFESGIKYLIAVVCVSAVFTFIAQPLGMTALSFGVVKPRNPKSILGVLLSSFIQDDKRTFVSNMFSLIQLGGVFLITDKEPANIRDIIFLSAVASGFFAFFFSVNSTPKYGSAGLITGLFSHLLLRGFLNSRPVYQAVAWAMAVYLYFGFDSVMNENSYELALGGCIAGMVTSVLSSTLSISSTASYYSSLIIDY